MRVLAISVHPDDETLGCGGTLLKHKASGESLYWMIVTQVHQPRWSREISERKAAEVQKVSDAYGMEQYFKLGFPTARLDKVSQADLIDRMQDVISDVKPEIVYLVHRGDVHTDHHAVFTATMSVLKPFHMARLEVRQVLCYETLSSTNAGASSFNQAFTPNVYSDITPYIQHKTEIMAMYETEAQSDPLPRGTSSIRALARYRGATISVEYAEAFMLIHQIS